VAQRLAPLTLEEMDDEQRRVYEVLAAGRARGVAGPLMAFLRNPRLAEIGQSFGGFCRRQTSLPPRLSELAILVTVARWRSAFQWHGHEKLGREEGLSSETIAALLSGATPSFAQADERAIYGFVTELIETRTVSQQTYDEAVGLLGELALVELVALVGYYVWGAMTVNAFALDPGRDGDPFAR
jgi:4-carboxymuconolactone decarboxylase